MKKLLKTSESGKPSSSWSVSVSKDSKKSLKNSESAMPSSALRGNVSKGLKKFMYFSEFDKVVLSRI